MQIRPAEHQDKEAIRNVYLAAFPEQEREMVASLAADLLEVSSQPETITLVAEQDHALIGHICFSPVSSRQNDGYLGYILCPLAVHPDFQKQQIGSHLIAAGFAALDQLTADILFVYGDPGFYGKFGFDVELAREFRPPYPLQHPFGWQARLLQPDNACPKAGALRCVEPLKNPQLW